MTFFNFSKYWYLGRLCVNVYALAGTWISFGVHLSIVPLYIDLHILWFVITLMSNKRGVEIHGEEKLYKECLKCQIHEEF